MYEGLKGWSPAPGLTGEVEFTPWAMADRFEECQVVGSPVRLRVSFDSVMARWIVLRGDEVMRHGPVLVGSDNARVAIERAKETAIANARSLLDDLKKPFTKSDATKPRAELLPPRALLAVSRVLTHGAAKYGHENHLRAGDDVENRYMGATLRHLLAHMSGEAADAETGESHLAHAAADLLLMLERSYAR